MSVSLELHGNSTSIDAELVHLKTLDQLKDLNLIDTRITDVWAAYLRPLVRLQNLYLSGTRITDAGLGHLKGLTELNELDLRGTKVTESGVAELKETLPNCLIPFCRQPRRPRVRVRLLASATRRMPWPGLDQLGK